jgi:hypothetical protein
MNPNVVNIIQYFAKWIWSTNYQTLNILNLRIVKNEEIKVNKIF